MKIKKISKTLLFSTILFSISSCSVTKKFLERPDNTNLEAWITEEINANVVEKFKYFPGMFGGEMYLGSKYELIRNGENEYLLPEIYVLYTYSGYPDCIDAYCLTSIEITDPEVFVYGLTINSTKEKVNEVMLANGFEEKGDNTYLKNNCNFTFSSNNIQIKAPSTNKHNIIY